MQRFRKEPTQSCEGYVFTPVCLSTGGGSASVHAGIPSPPQEQAPTPPEQTHPGIEPPGTNHPPAEG